MGLSATTYAPQHLIEPVWSSILSIALKPQLLNPMSVF